MIEHSVWTFVIQGGGAFRLGIPGNPVLEHEGGMTIWKLIGSEKLADEVEKAIREFGGQVKRHTEEQTPELIAARGRLPD